MKKNSSIDKPVITTYSPQMPYWGIGDANIELNRLRISALFVANERYDEAKFVISNISQFKWNDLRDELAWLEWQKKKHTHKNTHTHTHKYTYVALCVFFLKQK